MRLDSTIVGLTPCPDYAPSSLALCIDCLVEALGVEMQLSGSRVLLKPNLISVRKGPLPCTESAFILAAARWFIDHGARVRIGDSPAFGSTTSVLKRLGVIEELRFLGVEPVDFSLKRQCVLPSGVKADMAVEALDCDLLVNLPRVKAHGQMRLTLAVKNYFGCLVGLQKPWWHMAHGGSGGCFDDLLVELLSVLPESLTLVDGIRAMHVTGPIDGKPYPLRIMASAQNPIAADTALLALLGVAPEYSSLYRASVRADRAGTSLAELVFPLSDPNQLAVDDFLVPEVLNPIRFNPFAFIRSAVLRKLLLWKTKK